MYTLLHEQLARERASRLAPETATAVRVRRLARLRRAERRAARANRAAQRARVALVASWPAGR